MWADVWMDMAADKSPLRFNFLFILCRQYTIYLLLKTMVLTYSKSCIRFAFSHGLVLQILCTVNKTDENITLINDDFQRLVGAYAQKTRGPPPPPPIH
jgi:hypothetical protein